MALISEVELNKNNIRVNDILFYVDASNCMKFTVNHVDKKGLSLISLDAEYPEEAYYTFSELQFGWEISEKTKEYNRINYRTEYITNNH